MGVDNRLTADQLAALTPGDTVTIETALGGRRPRLSAGRVVRIESAHLVVSTAGPRGGKYVHHYGRRDGSRAGGGSRAELVNIAADEPAALDLARRRTPADQRPVPGLEPPADVDALRELRQAIDEYLQEATTTV